MFLREYLFIMTYMNLIDNINYEECYRNYGNYRMYP